MTDFGITLGVQEGTPSRYRLGWHPKRYTPGGGGGGLSPI